ncbi:MAG: signal peptidase II [Clostridia bacterium]|nr:signal peptidase II [Clostridia bacterium]
MFQFVSLLLIAGLVAADRVTKALVLKSLAEQDPKPVINGVLRLRYVENSGAAFSIFSDNTLMLTVFTALVLVLCLFILLTHKSKSKFVNAGLILVIAGGIGNEIDRIVSGCVIDFIEPLFVNFAVFNFADCCVTVGAFMLIVYELYEFINEKRKTGKDKND